MRAARAEYEERGIALCERFDAFAPLRNGLRRIARERGDWAGIPMPIDEARLIIEPRYPKAAELMSIGAAARGDTEHVEPECRVRNIFWSWRWRCNIAIWQNPDGSIAWTKLVRRRFDLELMTLAASNVWGIEQEARAVRTLGQLLRHSRFKDYLLTGMFAEVSARSGIMYVFRKLRPTLAISRDRSRLLCALCLHPIALYEDSWAGAMCPTDDVVAHLMLMRGDEPMLWRRSNQHPAWVPEAGL